MSRKGKLLEKAIQRFERKTNVGDPNHNKESFKKKEKKEAKK